MTEPKCFKHHPKGTMVDTVFPSAHGIPVTISRGSWFKHPDGKERQCIEGSRILRDGVRITSAQCVTVEEVDNAVAKLVATVGQP